MDSSRIDFDEKEATGEKDKYESEQFNPGIQAWLLKLYGIQLFSK